MMRGLKYGVPLALFVAVVAFLAMGLQRDPSHVPSPLVGKPAPEFTLPSLKAPDRTVSRADLLGRVTLLNAWATWCVSCRQEHPLLVEIARNGTAVYGLNYKDNRDDALRWLERLGDPYIASAYDPDGRVGIDFGVYGLPETFLLDAEGNVAYKHIGPLTPEVWEQKMLPIVRRLEGGPE